MGRRKQSHDAAALLLVAGIFVIAAIGVYLLAIAAVALVGWLVRLATKRAPVVAGEPHVAAPLPAHAEYHAIIPVEVASFESPERLRAAARQVFNAWVAKFPSAPGDASDLVRAVTSQPRLIGRLTTELEGRRLVWRAAPKTGRAALGGPPLDPSRLDPWNPPEQLRSTSTYFTSCWTCGGDGKVSCVPCGGSGKRTCGSCSGSGKYYGVTANGAQRMLNCKECRGKGAVGCQACARGTVECSTCQKAKRLECWLEIDESSRQDVQVEPDGAMTKAFAWGQDGVRASSADIARDAKLIDSVTHTRSLSLHDLPAAVPHAWREHYWSRIQAQIQPGERVRSQTFTLLEVPATTVSFAVGNDVHDVTFEGLQMLAPPANVGSPFAARARALKRLKAVLATLPITALIIYLARGSYFQTERTGPLVAAIIGSAVLVAACSYAVVWYSTVGRRVARTWAALTVAPLAAACVCAVLVEPSAARARDLVAAGRLDKARFELEALGSPSDPELVPVWSDLFLADTLAATTCTDATQRLAKIALPGQRAKAQAHADALAVTVAQSALDQGHADDARSTLLCASDASRGTPAAKTLGSRIALSSAGSCSITKDWDCVFRYTTEATALGAGVAADSVRSSAMTSIRADVDVASAAARTEKDRVRRVSYQRAAIGLWTKYMLPEGGADPHELTVLKNANAADQHVLARAEAVALKRQQAEELRAQQRAAAEERQRLASEARTRAREEAAERRRERTERLELQQPSRSCCKVCSSGCACGDSCISCSKTCHKGRGCAC